MVPTLQGVPRGPTREGEVGSPNRVRTRRGKARGIHLGHFPRHFSKDEKGRIVPTATARRVVALRTQGESWGATSRALNLTRSEARNIVRFLGGVATDVQAEA